MEQKKQIYKETGEAINEFKKKKKLKKF